MKRAVGWTLAVVVVLAVLLLAPLPWPGGLAGTRIDNVVEIAAPPPQVFAYVATPANWPRWHPASRAVRGVTDRTPAAGESVIETYEIGGRRDDATWTTVELDAPRRWRFSATSAHRGGSAEIAYTLTPIDSGTRFRREMYYRGPNLLFALLNQVELKAQIERDSATALANVKRDVEAAAPK
jgi:uncharacterized protein YndB with AHSA1/START domain